MLNKIGLLIALITVAALTASSARAALVDDVYRKSDDVTISCTASNGVEVQSKSAKDNVVTTKLAGYTRDFRMSFNPSFGTLTWLSLFEEGEVLADGYQIFLFGNAIEGQDANLAGSIGRLATVPLGPTGMVYPVGFVPLAGITCHIAWQTNP